MSNEEWKLVCKSCGNLIVPDKFTNEKWYHASGSKYGFWCYDSTGTRRAPKPDYDASEKINEHKRGDIYDKTSDLACPKCNKPNLTANYYVFWGGPKLTGYWCQGCNSSFNTDMQDCTLYLAAEPVGDWDN